MPFRNSDVVRVSGRVNVERIKLGMMKNPTELSCGVFKGLFTQLVPTSLIDEVLEQWPSGTVQEFHDVAPKKSRTITEPPRLSAARMGGQPQFSLKGGRYMTCDIQTSTKLTDWSPGSPVTITNFNGSVPIPIPMPQDGPQQFYRAVLR